jgi:hypothetical protein
MHRRARSGEKNYVVTPDGAECAAQCRLWDHIDRGRVAYRPGGTVTPGRNSVRNANYDTIIRRVTTSPATFILDYTRDDRRWLWLSARQFLDAPEESLVPLVPGGWADTGFLDAPGATVSRTPRERALLWLRLFERLSIWWLSVSKAPMGLTGSALSMGILRTHVAKRALCTHTDPDAHQLERAACFGGMARTWYYGDIGELPSGPTVAGEIPAASVYGRVNGPMTLLDVRSMYPWLLREREYPCKLKEYRENATASEPQQLAPSYGVIARVTIETRAAEYPERVGDRIYYRTGRFQTTLTGPELLALRRDGKVIRCHALAVYHMGAPFRRAADACIRMREDARDRKEPAWELFAKLVGNGLGGKLAQRRGEWEYRAGMSAPLRYGEWYDTAKGGRGMTRFRSVAGLVWEWKPDESGAGPYTAAFAYLAAYGRLHMRGIRDECPEKTVLSMDTDGLWLLPDAVSALEDSRLSDGSYAGALRVSDTSEYGRFLGPRHYYTASGWVLSGFAVPSVSDGGGMVRASRRYTPVGGRDGGAPRGTAVRDTVSRLAVEAHGVKVAGDGWAHPAHRR